MKVATMLLYVRNKSWQRLVSLHLRVLFCDWIRGNFITVALVPALPSLSRVNNFALVVKVRLTKQQSKLCFFLKKKKTFIELEIRKIKLSNISLKQARTCAVRCPASLSMCPWSACLYSRLQKVRHSQDPVFSDCRWQRLWSSLESV